MKPLLIFCALAIVSVAGALLFVERRIRARTRRVRAALSPPSGEPLLELRMRQSTSFGDGLPAPLLPAGEVQVLCTTASILVGRFAIPLATVEDAAIESGALHLRWNAGGEKLETVLEGPLHDLERLRREVHLRQPNVVEKLLAMVQK